MLNWRFHFDNEMPINWLSTQWERRYKLDFGPWRWSALNMGFVDIFKWPSRMQGQWFSQSPTGGQKLLVGSRKSGFLFGQLPLPESTSPEKIMGGRGTPPWCHLGGCTKQIYIKQMMTKPSLWVLGMENKYLRIFSSSLFSNWQSTPTP